MSDDRCRLITGPRLLARADKLTAAWRQLRDARLENASYEVLEKRTTKMDRLLRLSRTCRDRGRSECSECIVCGNCRYHGNCPSIHGYHVGPKSGWQFCSHPGLKLGVETEIEVVSAATYSEVDRRTELAHLVGRSHPRIHIENDGSLVWGMELISHPGCLDCTRKEMLSLGRTLRGEPVKTTKTCGVHVHVAWATGTALRRMRRLFHASRSGFARMLCGRLSERYANLHWGDGDPHSRYVAVNTETGGGTVELRLFKGALSGATLARYVETAAAIREWATAGPLVPNLAVGFVEWSMERAAIYPRLARHLSRHEAMHLAEIRSHAVREEEMACA